MRTLKLYYHKSNLPFQYPFTISKGTKTTQPSLIVCLELGPFRGYGEAPAISYYNVSVDSMVEAAEQKRRLVEKFAFTDPERYWHYLHHLFPNNPFLVCALDMAGWDLWGNMKRQPLYQLWNTSFSDANPLTNYTIGIDSIETMLAKMEANPNPIYKVKLGTPNDIAIIETLRRKTESIIRVDANGAWKLTEAMTLLPRLAELGVELVEQPLAKDDWEGMKQLYNFSPIPLIADESCVEEEDVAKCVNHFHGINIKLTKCSGITPARVMISKARELGLKVMMGSMNESSIGSAAIANFLPQLDYVDMDGPLLLSGDIAEGLVYQYGKVSLSAQPGLGISIKADTSFV